MGEELGFADSGGKLKQRRRSLCWYAPGPISRRATIPSQILRSDESPVNRRSCACRRRTWVRDPRQFRKKVRCGRRRTNRRARTNRARRTRVPLGVTGSQNAIIPARSLPRVSSTLPQPLLIQQGQFSRRQTRASSLTVPERVTAYRDRSPPVRVAQMNLHRHRATRRCPECCPSR